MGRYEIDGIGFAQLLEAGAGNLKKNADIVNDLNVFPIPDGDTGSNMLMTIEGGLRGIQKPDASIGKTSAEAASGMLLGARGNSGVILSQIFAGVAKGLEGLENAKAQDLARAMKKGVETGYKAVVNPTEGTILTVAREAADYAASVTTDESSIEEYWAAYLSEAEASLQRTPELLAVLKEAGVVDSGGAGLYYIIEGMLAASRGEDVRAMDIEFIDNSTAPKEMDFSKFNENSVMEFGYCTEFLLQLQKCKCNIDEFTVEKDMIPYLESMGGDSIVCFKNGSVVKVHVHTMTPSRVLECAQRFGEFLKVKIENMTLQHSESVVRNRFKVATPQARRKKFAMVVVATGEGIKNTFKDLGADYVIDGGQGRNPSSEDFITAFRSVNADTIFVLPNNGNIVLAARQAAGLFDASDVHVIESRNLGEGYAAMTMLSYDSGDTAEIESELRAAMEGVVTGLVSTSVRDTNLNGIAISMHDYIGFTNKTMLAADKDKIRCAMTLLKNLKVQEHEYLIAIYGKSASEDDRRAFRSSMSEDYPSMELYEIDGGQEVYDFMFILQ
ncbi:MAG: DAK2 domain-containing protein [Spirochaetales bacterium]|nr:DAK2 domain-containing protein [Spirochaetales bacterium]